MRKQFTFYSSFYAGISRIEDAVIRAEAYDAICAYALDGKEPDLDNMPGAAALAFIMAKPNLDASKKKAAAGKQGGKSRGKANVKQNEANGKQEQIEIESKQEQEQSLSEIENKKEDKNKIEYECTPPTPSERGSKQEPPQVSDYGFSFELESAVNSWLAYKRERREGYKPTGLKSLLTQVKNSAAEHGDAAVIDIIRQSMANGYQGIVFDRLKKGGAPSGARGSAAESPKPKRDWGITYDV